MIRSTRQKLKLPVFSTGLAILALGCSSEPAFRVVEPPPPEPPLPTYQLHGTAYDDDAHPVAGVKVTVFAWQSNTEANRITTETDGTGAYSVSFQARARANGFVGSVTSEKDGYEPDYQYLYESTGTQNLRVYRTRQVIAGDSIRVTVVAGDPRCTNTEDGWICRVIRVKTPTAGTITISAIPDPFSAKTNAMELATPPYSCCALAQSVHATEVDEVVAHIMTGDTEAANQTFTIKTFVHPDP
jgi:hypothetical protein